MAQGFVNLGNLIPGERYSFTTKDFPGGRSQGTFDRVSFNPGMNNQFFFSNVLEPNGPAGNVNYGNPHDYPRKIIHLPLEGAPPPQPPRTDDGELVPQPSGRGVRSRKTKRRRHRKSKRTRKSRRRR